MAITSKRLRSLYDRETRELANLAGTLKGALEEFLTKANIEYSNVNWRIKTFDSFAEKQRRKKYADPIRQTTDLCGLRVVYLYTADLARIVKLLDGEFVIVESEDKDFELAPDRFGYRSYHAVAKLRDDWLHAPGFRDYRGQTFEIQVRSVLMDAWANVSHQLFYKRELGSAELQRRLYRLSAMMEIADNEIDNLISLLGPREGDETVKALQSLLDKYLPERGRSGYTMVSKLCREMEQYGLSNKDLEDFLSDRSKLHELEAIEKKAFAVKRDVDGLETRWMQIGIVRAVMYLTLEEYWNAEGRKYPEDFVRVIDAHRKKRSPSKKGIS